MQSFKYDEYFIIFIENFIITFVLCNWCHSNHGGTKRNVYQRIFYYERIEVSWNCIASTMESCRTIYLCICQKNCDVGNKQIQFMVQLSWLITFNIWKMWIIWTLNSLFRSFKIILWSQSYLRFRWNDYHDFVIETFPFSILFSFESANWMHSRHFWAIFDASVIVNSMRSIIHSTNCIMIDAIFFFNANDIIGISHWFFSSCCGIFPRQHNIQFKIIKCQLKVIEIHSFHLRTTN